MLIPKRVKRRKQHKGRMTGAAHKGNTVAYGEYGLVAEECGWIKIQSDRSRPYRHDEIHQARR